MDKKVLTKQWFLKLQEELKILKTEKLPTVLIRLKDAIWQWDISENSDYDAAMSEKDLLEVRIREIEELLENVEILEDHISSGEVKYNSTVIIEDEKWKKYEYRIVWTWEMDILDNTISFDSPLGNALKNKVVWDIVSVRAPRGKYKVKILEIK